MRKVTYIILVIMVFVTGCNAKYNLEIDKESIYEKLIVEEENANIWVSLCDKYSKLTCTEYFKEQTSTTRFANIDDVNYIANHYVPEDTVFDSKKLYATSYIEERNKIGYSYEYNFNIEDYYKSSILNTCIENIDYIKDKSGIIKIHASGKFLCTYEYIDNVKVSIKSNYYTIKNSNANSKLFGTHAWKLDVDGENDVYFELYDEPQKEKLLKIVIAMFIVAAIATPIIILFMIARRKKNNEI